MKGIRSPTGRFHETPAAAVMHLLKKTDAFLTTKSTNTKAKQQYINIF